MGRLFWKFFFFFWLAQFITSLGVGAAIWALRPAHETHDRPPAAPSAMPHPLSDQPAGMDRPPPPPPRPALLPPLLPIAAGSIVSLLFAVLLAWYFARPIRTLRNALAATAEGQLHTRVGIAMGTRQDELADLGGDFDRMVERMQALVDSQRRLLHDVSHELRSPLARLQVAAELMQQQPERALQFIDHIARDTGRMDRLVGELLTLARLDDGSEQGENGSARAHQKIDLIELVEEIAADAQLEAEPRNCRIELELIGEILVTGQPELLHRAIENVLRNALHYSAPGGIVRVSASVHSQQLSLSITDSGPGVAEDELIRIFEPFHRARAADPFSGHGLGLAITRSVMHLHGGSVRAENRPEGGLRVTLSLPLTKG